MGLAFPHIADDFHAVFGFLQGDLERMLTVHPGVNCAAAVLIACGCETLAWYRHSSPDGTLVFPSLLPDGPFRAVGKSIYAALRNGLVHKYDAKTLCIGNARVGIGIAWHETPHLSFREENGLRVLVLNVRDLATQLNMAFAAYRAELERSDHLRDTFVIQQRRRREHPVLDTDEVAAWSRILEST
jgi:hypothetical protein